MLYRYYFLLALTFLSLTTIGQQNKPMLPYAIQQGTLNEQFTQLSNLSRSQDADFKLIRKTNLDIVRRNVLDSISKYTKEIAELKAFTSGSQTTVKNLKDTITSLETQLAYEKAKTNSISFLGIDFSKGSYHTLVWSIIVILALAFLFSFGAFRKSKVDTVEHKKTVEELQEELQTLRKKSMEKEQLLKRQLLDEQLKRNS